MKGIDKDVKQVMFVVSQRIYGQKLYQNSQCENPFSDNTNLKIHLRTHTGEAPYQCSQCKRGFSQKSNLKKHLSIHTGETCYQCNQYEKAFSQNTNL